MDTKVKGIIIKLIDYKDSDKLAQIFSLEQGIITAKFTGVKKEKAKFKAVAQPFVFADFVINEKNDHRTITSVDIIDSFDRLLSDYSRMMVGYVILDMIRRIIPEQKSETDIFLLTLSTLKRLETEDQNSLLVDYIIKFISLSGLAIEFPKSKYVYLDQLTGNFSTTPSSSSIQIDKKVYSYIYQIANSEAIEFKDENNRKKEDDQTLEKINYADSTTPSEDKNDAFSITTIKQALRLMRNIIYLKFGTDIKSFDYL